MTVVLAAILQVWLAALPQQPAWEPLFDGRTLNGWSGDPDLWNVENGTIVGRSTGLKHNVFLVTRRRFSDFIFECKVRVRPDTANSGIQFRSEVLPDGEMYGYQADIGQKWWGSLYDESTGRGLLVDAYAERGAGAVRREDWNEYRIECSGSRVRLSINGVLTSEYEDGLRRPDGHIALQMHSGGPMLVEFRDLRIQETGSTASQE